MKRTIVTLHLPLEMGSVGRTLQVIGAFYPDATVAPGDDSASLEIQADPDAAQPATPAEGLDVERLAHDPIVRREWAEAPGTDAGLLTFLRLVATQGADR